MTNKSRIILLGVLSVFAGAVQTIACAQTHRSAAASGPPAGTKEDFAAADLRAIKKPPLPAFHPQQPKRIQFDNGLVVFLQEDHELPLFEARILIRGGAQSEPEAKTGLVSIFGGSWRMGGTKTHTGDQLDDLLEARASRIETAGNMVSTYMDLSSLKGDTGFVLDLANDLLRNPEFREEKIDLIKEGMLSDIARRNDTPSQIADREGAKIGYGAHSPYARSPEYATVASITRQDLIDWYHHYVHPNNIIISVYGDFDPSQLESKLRSLFAEWPRGPIISRVDVPIAPPKPGVYFAAKDDINQSEIRLIAGGIRRNDPDYYAVSVLNAILGGGMSSRLVSSLRTKAGLAYSVGGSVYANFAYPGLTILQAATKSGTTAQAIDGLYREIDNIAAHGVSREEAQRGKDVILNSFIFDYDSKDKVLDARLTYEFHGYPLDFLEQYQQGIQNVTAADVNRVAKKFLDRNKFALLVVGKADDFDRPLSSFGSVQVLDITILQPAHASGTAVYGADGGAH